MKQDFSTVTKIEGIRYYVTLVHLAQTNGFESLTVKGMPAMRSHVSVFSDHGDRFGMVLHRYLNTFA